MSYATDKGRAAEVAVVRYLNDRGFAVYRPRTTSRRDTDTGDVAGLPVVVSVKDHKTLRLALWVDELLTMVRRSPWRVGMVVHKRTRKGDPGAWYVTLPLEMVVPMLDAYVTQTSRPVAQPRRTTEETEPQL